MARPSKFPVGQEAVIKMLVLKGCTDNELAEAFDVHADTIQNWKKQRPEFFESLKDWKLQADKEVEKSLYNRAIGAKVIEEKAVFSQDGGVDIIQTTKEYPPETAACVVWLANRQPNNWKKDPSSNTSADTIADAFMKIVERLPD